MAVIVERIEQGIVDQPDAGRDFGEMLEPGADHGMGREDGTDMVLLEDVAQRHVEAGLGDLGQPGPVVVAGLSRIEAQG